MKKKTLFACLIAAHTNLINRLSSLLPATRKPPPSVITPKYVLYCIPICSTPNYYLSVIVYKLSLAPAQTWGTTPLY